MEVEKQVLENEKQLKNLWLQVNRIARKIDQLLTGGILHVRERLTIFEYEVNIGGLLSLAGSLTVGGNLTVMGTSALHGNVTLYSNLLFDPTSDGYIGFSDDIENAWIQLYQSAGNTFIDFYGMYVDISEGWLDAERVNVGDDCSVAARFAVGGWSVLRDVSVYDYLAVSQSDWQLAVTPPSGVVADIVGDMRIFDETNLGPELHTDPNAASDPNGNEADATTGWTASGGTFASDATWSPNGSYSLKLTATGANQYIEYPFTAVVGQMYRVSFKGKGIYFDPSLGIHQRVVSWTNLGTVSANFNDFSSATHTFGFYVVATGTAAKIRIYASFGSYTAGDLVYVDNVSIQAVLPGGGDLTIGGTLTANELVVTGGVTLDIVCHNDQVVCHSDNVVYL